MGIAGIKRWLFLTNSRLARHRATDSTIHSEGSISPNNPGEFLCNFESIGENCEFGFVLGKYGISDGSLFRWANLRDFSYLIDALNGHLKGLFQAQNLIPITKNLLRDSRYGIEFHTKMPIGIEDGRFRFAVPFEERRDIYESENSKIQYLADKFIQGVALGSRIYVLRGRSPIPLDTAREVLRSIRQYGDATVLLVTRASDANQSGTVRVIQDNLYHGFVRHISADTMEDIDYESWFEMCKFAWNLHVSLRRSTE
jgi:hypothetical protein